MSRRPLTVTLLVALVAALAVVPAAVAKGGGGSKRTIALHASSTFPAATGKAASRVRDGERELEVEVEHVRRLAGKRVNVFVNGRWFARPRVSSLGGASVERSTERGQRVPRIRAGSTVRVRTLAGTLIAGGRF